MFDKSKRPKVVLRMNVTFSYRNNSRTVDHYGHVVRAGHVVFDISLHLNSSVKCMFALLHDSLHVPFKQGSNANRTPRPHRFLRCRSLQYTLTNKETHRFDPQLLSVRVYVSSPSSRIILPRRPHPISRGFSSRSLLLFRLISGRSARFARRGQ